MKRQAIAFSGTHGTGKTFSTYQKAKELKEQHPTKSVYALCDMEAFCPFPINKQTTAATQSWLFSNHIIQVAQAMARFDLVVIDRTLADIIAYTIVGGCDDLAQAMITMAAHHMEHYQSIHFKAQRYNKYLYNDGIREATDLEFRKEVEDAMIKVYKQLMPFIHRLYYV